MAHNMDPEKIILETRQYEFSDGLREIQLGFTILLMGVFWFWLMYQPAWLVALFQVGKDYGSWAITLAFILLMLVPVLAAWGLQSIMGVVRRRWLWRRSGEVKPSRVAVPAPVSIIAVVVFIALVLLGLVLQQLLKTGEFYAWSLILTATGWSFGVTLSGLGRSIRVQRYVYLGVLGGLASTALLLFQSSFGGPGLIFSIGWGILLIASGVIVLQRAWPQVAEDQNEG